MTSLINNLNKNIIKNIFITGGGTGIGKEIASVFFKNGYNVIIASRKEAVINKAVDEIRTTKLDNNINNNIIGKTLDVRNYDEVVDFKNFLKKDNLFPDIVVNNAAGNFISPSENLSINAWNSVIDIVLKGTINITTIFGKEMINEKKKGSFINISTTYADTGSGFVVPSSVSKAGCDNLVKSLAAEWGKYNIRLVGVAPGPIYTKGAFSRLDPTGEFIKHIENKIPLGRLPTKDELAKFILYLGSDDALPITGEIIKFDGGETVMNSGEFNLLSKLTIKDWERIRSMA